jgi:hypothetical protein
MGTVAGVNTLTATVPGLPPVTFKVLAQADSAIAMTALADNPLTGFTGLSVSPVPGVRLTDRFGNPVIGQLVNFAPAPGSGQLTGATAFTNGDGDARPIAWTLPIAAGTYVLRASARSLSAELQVTAAPAQSEFDIDVRFTVPVTAAQRAAFVNAAARWRSAITGDIPAITLTAADGVDANACGIVHPAVRETIDDLIIFVELRALDGPGKLLGEAGPCIRRIPSNLPISGTMKFDTDDLTRMEQNGTLTQVIMHEMGHVLGFGTLWGFHIPSLVVGSGGADPYFSGSAATDYFALAGGTVTNGVPVENCVLGVPPTCGAGTRDAHWRESTFGAELMTGYIGAGLNPLSTVTIASLADLGYTVNLAAADDYHLPTSSGSALRDMTGLEHLNEKLRQPIRGIRR